MRGEGWCAGAVELRNALNSSFQLELSSTVTFDHPTVAALAAHIAGLTRSCSVPDRQGRAASSSLKHVDKRCVMAFPRMCAHRKTVFSDGQGSWAMGS